jgi:transketolase
MNPSLPLEKISAQIRADIIEMVGRAGSAHLASALSCVDLLVALYFQILKIDPANPKDPRRDRCILSKGHAVSALYATLARKGFFPLEELKQFNCDGGHLPEQPSPGCAPGVEWATGSLGHGLGVGLGMALASKIIKSDSRVYVVMSDGECNEGSVWEAAMSAPALGLNQVTVLVDYNKWQATARSEEVLSLKPLAKKWESFGWEAIEVDGHDLKAIISAAGKALGDKPRAIIAHTVKGKGVSFMEDDNNWHYRAPTPEEVDKSKQELGIL